MGHASALASALDGSKGARSVMVWMDACSRAKMLPVDKLQLVCTAILQASSAFQGRNWVNSASIYSGSPSLSCV